MKTTTRSKFDTEAGRRLALRRTPSPVYFRLLDYFESYAQKESPVKYCQSISQISELTDKQVQCLAEDYVGGGGSVLLKSRIWVGKTLDGRMDRCPAVVRAACLQKALGGKDITTFALTFGDTEISRSLESSRGFTRDTKRRLDKALTYHLGRVPDYFFFVEISPKGRLHLHGLIVASNEELICVKSAMVSISSLPGRRVHFGQAEGAYQTGLRLQECIRRGLKVPGLNCEISDFTSEDRKALQQSLRDIAKSHICITQLSEFSPIERYDYSYAAYSVKGLDNLKRFGRGQLGRGWAASSRDMIKKASSYHRALKHLLEAN